MIIIEMWLKRLFRLLEKRIYMNVISGLGKCPEAPGSSVSWLSCHWYQNLQRITPGLSVFLSPGTQTLILFFISWFCLLFISSLDDLNQLSGFKCNSYSDNVQFLFSASWRSSQYLHSDVWETTQTQITTTELWTFIPETSPPISFLMSDNFIFLICRPENMRVILSIRKACTFKIHTEVSSFLHAPRLRTWT